MSNINVITTSVFVALMYTWHHLYVFQGEITRKICLCATLVFLTTVSGYHIINDPMKNFVYCLKVKCIKTKNSYFYISYHKQHSLLSSHQTVSVVLISGSILTSSEGSGKATNIYTHKISPSGQHNHRPQPWLISTLPSPTPPAIPPRERRKESPMFATSWRQWWWEKVRQ